MSSEEVILSVEGLNIRHTANPFPLVSNVSLRLCRGQTLGLVGESGSGKSLTLRSLMGLVPQPLEVSGAFKFRGPDARGLRDYEPAAEQGHSIAMIFQEPMRALNPFYTAGWTVAEPLRMHMGLSRRQAATRAKELLRSVGVSEPERIARSYPHQLSGGLRQRVVIAAALATNPAVLLCDEPTTALDVTTQAQIIRLLKGLQAEFGLSMVFVSHDLAVVSEVSEQIAVMFRGGLVETGETRSVLTSPKHEYTRGLLNSVPSRGERGQRFQVFDSATITNTESTVVGQ